MGAASGIFGYAKDKEFGSFFLLQCGASSRRIVACLGYFRGAGPKLAAFAMCTWAGDQISIDCVDGGFKILGHHALAMHVFEASGFQRSGNKPTNLKMQILKYTDLPGSFLVVGCKARSCGRGAEVWTDKDPVRAHVSDAATDKMAKLFDEGVARLTGQSSSSSGGPAQLPADDVAPVFFFNDLAPDSPYESARSSSDSSQLDREQALTELVEQAFFCFTKNGDVQKQHSESRGDNRKTMVARAPAKRPRGFAQKLLGKRGGKPPSGPSTVQDPEPVQEEAADQHVYWWLTRTNRKATCNNCRQPIEAGSFRILFHPNESSVEDKRIWKDLFWRYHHVDWQCLPRMVGMPEPTEDKSRTKTKTDDTEAKTKNKTRQKTKGQFPIGHCPSAQEGQRD